jgi:transcriptional regulator with XRE-family HTH domain
MNLKEWRLAHQLTQPQLAQLLGVSALTIYRWENGYSQKKNEGTGNGKHRKPDQLVQLALAELDRRLAERRVGAM